MPTRIPSLLEQAIQSNASGTNNAVKEQLGIQEFDSSILQNQITANTNQIAELSGSISNVESAILVQVAEISGNLTIDMNNLDISLTEGLVTMFDISGSSATGGSATLPSNPVGFISVISNGMTIKLPFYV